MGALEDLAARMDTLEVYAILAAERQLELSMRLLPELAGASIGVTVYTNYRGDDELQRAKHREQRFTVQWLGDPTEHAQLRAYPMGYGSVDGDAMWSIEGPGHRQTSCPTSELLSTIANHVREHAEECAARTPSADVAGVS